MMIRLLIYEMYLEIDDPINNLLLNSTKLPTVSKRDQPLMAVLFIEKINETAEWNNNPNSLK